MTREWIKPDRRICVSLAVDGLTWSYAEKPLCVCGAPCPAMPLRSESGNVFGDPRRFWQAVRAYWRKV